MKLSRLALAISLSIPSVVFGQSLECSNLFTKMDYINPDHSKLKSVEGLDLAPLKKDADPYEKSIIAMVNQNFLGIVTDGHNAGYKIMNIKTGKVEYDTTPALNLRQRFLNKINPHDLETNVKLHVTDNGTYARGTGITRIVYNPKGNFVIENKSDGVLEIKQFKIATNNRVNAIADKELVLDLKEFTDVKPYEFIASTQMITSPTSSKFYVLVNIMGSSTESNGVYRGSEHSLTKIRHMLLEVDPTTKDVTILWSAFQKETSTKPVPPYYHNPNDYAPTTNVVRTLNPQVRGVSMALSKGGTALYVIGKEGDKAYILERVHVGTGPGSGMMNSLE